MLRYITASINGFILIAILLLPIPLAAQNTGKGPPRYTVMVLGTLGGTFSTANGVSNDAAITGFSTLPEDAVVHAFIWRKGVITDLGTLGGPNSFAGEGSRPNERGEVAGFSATPTLDPYGEGFCDAIAGSRVAPFICRPFVWRRGVMTELPTLGGNNGIAAGINNRGQVAGVAETATVDPTCPPPQIFAFEAVIWEPNGSGIRELPPLPGDTGASAAAINDKGQAVGTSGTCAVGPIEAVLWEKGKPIDLGNLGGAVFNIAFALNNRGQIIGQSNLPGNTTHHAFLWQNGVMTDLGTLRGVPGSLAEGINNKGQVVGFSDDFQGNEVALLWQNGAMFDMNTLVSTDSPWFLQEALGINERGQIVGFALNTISGEVHGFLATPIEGSESPATAAQARSTETPRVIVPEKVREMLRHQYRWPGLGK